MLRTALMLLGTAAASFVAGTLTSAALSQGQQSPPPAVVEVDFMKPERGQEEAYYRLETETWKRIHQERVRQGHMRSWALYGRQYPSGTANDYDYVTVNVYGSFADADRDLTQLIREVLPRINPKLPADSLFQQTDRARKLVRGEIWRLLDHVE
jgi:hypothetical protein